MATVLPCGGNATTPFPGQRLFNQTYKGEVVNLIPVTAGGLTTLNFDFPIDGSAIQGSVKVFTVYSVGGTTATSPVVYIADDLSTAGVLETQGGTTVVGSISSYSRRLTGTITFPTALTDNTWIKIGFTPTLPSISDGVLSGENVVRVVARAYDEDPCDTAIRSYTPAVGLRQFAATVCSVDLCAGDAPGLYLNDLLVATPNGDGSFSPVSTAASTFSYDFTGVAANYALSSIVVNGVDIVTTDITAATNLANLVAALNTSTVTSRAAGVGTWTVSGNIISVRSTAVLGSISGTGNSIAFGPLVPTITAATGNKAVNAYWQRLVSQNATCDCGVTYLVNAYTTGDALSTSDSLEFRNGTEVVSLIPGNLNCLYTFTLPAVTGTGYSITSLLANGVNALGAAPVAGGTLEGLVVALNSLASPLGRWFITATANQIAIRSSALIGAITGTNNGTAFGPTAPVRSNCIAG